jgi:hypothetical protein
MRAGEPRRWSGTGRALGGVPSRARRALKCSYGDGLKRPLRTAMSGRSAGSKPFERRRAAHDRVRMQAATALRRRPTRTALEEAVKTREGVYVCVYAKSSRCSRCAASRVCAELRLQVQLRAANRLPNLVRLVLARKGANADFRSPRSSFSRGDGHEAAGRQAAWLSLRRPSA